MLYFEGGGLTITDSTSRTFLPKWLCQDDQRLRNLRRCSSHESLWTFIRDRQPRSVGLYRTYALGDILMLMPLARLLHRVCGLKQPVRVIVAGRFCRMLKGVGRDGRVALLTSVGMADYGCDIHIDLNGALESDHRGGEASDHHRMMLYARAMGLPLEGPECPI